MNHRDFQGSLVAVFHEKLRELQMKCDLVDAYRKNDYSSVAHLDNGLYGAINPFLVEESVGKIFGHGGSTDRAEMLGSILSKHRIEELLRENIDRIGLKGVVIEWGDSGLSRIAVSHGRYPKIRISEQAIIREREFLSIFAHEVETHLVRSIRGEETGLLLFKHGTGFSLGDEEGLAVWKSLQALPPDCRKDAMYEQYFLVSQAQHRSFSQLADTIRSLRSDRSLSYVFNLCLRLKRGIERTSIRGEGVLYGKNKIYLDGYRRVADWISQGNDPDRLLIGKIKISDLQFITE